LRLGGDWHDQRGSEASHEGATIHRCGLTATGSRSDESMTMPTADGE
jgi:hypothetical protein